MSELQREKNTEQAINNYLIKLEDKELLAMHDACAYSDKGYAQMDLIGLAYLSSTGRRKVLAKDELTEDEQLIILRFVVRYGGAAKDDLIELLWILKDQGKL